MAKKVLVKCTLEIEVEVPEEWDEDRIRFAIEENSDPATGIVGGAINDLMEECDQKSICWACKIGAKNEVISIDGIDVGVTKDDT